MDYLFGSRILTHLLFWITYYILFGFIWAKDGDYGSSYFLEFVLLPVRIGVSYASLYLLLPKFLLPKKILKFIALYTALLIAGAIVQRFFIYFFLEQQTHLDLRVILSGASILRALILINSTALFLMALKVLALYFRERSINEPIHDAKIEVKSDKRFYRIHPSEILYLEGLGNYITYYLSDGRKIIGYNSLKNANNELPDYFIRIHKSFIVNAQAVISYDKTSVEILKQKFLPIGNSYEFEI